jgi:hypothetical protein
MLANCCRLTNFTELGAKKLLAVPSRRVLAAIIDVRTITVRFGRDMLLFFQCPLYVTAIQRDRQSRRHISM